MKIELDIDLDKHLSSYRGTDFDGYPVEPMTLADVVIREAGQHVATLLTQKQISSLAAVIKEQLDHILQDRLTRAVTETLDRGLPVDGDYTGKRWSLEEAVQAILQKLLKEERNWGGGYNEPRRTVVAHLVEQAVTHQVKAEIGKAVEEGRAEVKKALRAHAATVLTETIERMASG